MTFSPYDIIVLTLILLFTSGAAPYVSMLIAMVFEVFFGPIEMEDEDDEGY